MKEFIQPLEAQNKRPLHPAKTPGKFAAEIRRKYAKIEELKEAGK
jgi:hypothetical protein